MKMVKTQSVATVQIPPFDTKSTSKLKSPLHFKYSIVIKVALKIPSFVFKFAQPS